MNKAKQLNSLVAEAIKGNQLHFGLFAYSLPIGDKDAEDGAGTLGSGGMDGYIDYINTHDEAAKQPNLFRDAARELQLQLPAAEKWMKERIKNEKFVELYMGDLKGVLTWFSRGYRNQYQWSQEKKQWEFQGY